MANPNPVPACAEAWLPLHEGKEDTLAILLAYAGPGILNLKSYLGSFAAFRDSG